MPLILASQSPTRRAMLAAAGLAFTAVSPPVDEDAAKESFRAEGASPRDLADGLAELKAVAAARRAEPDSYVIGADQVLSFEGRTFDKAKDLQEARARLRTMRGKPHELITAAVLVHAGSVIWRHVETPRLTMRDLSDEAIDTYVAQHGEAALGSVGCYQLEAAGVQLMSRVEGDWFSILGLPLLPLLDVLRRHRLAPG